MYLALQFEKYIGMLLHSILLDLHILIQLILSKIVV